MLKLIHEKSKKDKKAGKLLCNWKFETRKPNYLKSCSPLYCAESDLPTIPNAQLEGSCYNDNNNILFNIIDIYIYIYTNNQI